MYQKTVIIISGPTASGKTDLAMETARYFDTSIISADSRQCYRELNIGVAKPDAAQLKEIPHAFINTHSIHDTVNAAIFEDLAKRYCEEIFSDRDVVVMVGGTGLYIKAFRDGLDEIPIIGNGIREAILLLYQKKGIGWLQEKLRELDPSFAESGETSNPQRMMRALEVVQSTGRSIQSFRNLQKKQNPFRILEFGIQMPRKELYNRINQRVDNMVSAGLQEEARELIPFQHLNALQTVGYKEFFECFNGRVSVENCISLIKQNTRHYAKRQQTWLNKTDQLTWIGDNYLHRIIDAFSATKI
jgi:tRNA dimethylallyltransferase